MLSRLSHIYVHAYIHICIQVYNLMCVCDVQTHTCLFMTTGEQWVILSTTWRPDSDQCHFLSWISPLFTMCDLKKCAVLVQNIQQLVQDTESVGFHLNTSVIHIIFHCYYSMSEWHGKIPVAQCRNNVEKCTLHMQLTQWLFHITERLELAVSCS